MTSCEKGHPAIVEGDGKAARPPHFQALRRWQREYGGKNLWKKKNGIGFFKISRNHGSS